MTNTTRKLFSIISFGSSHGKAMGAVLDGCPANLELSEKDIKKELDKKKAGTGSITSPKQEKNEARILSGILEGKTDVTRITGVIFNKDQRFKDYNYLKNIPRQRHGDYTWIEKYGNYDYNSGSRGSGKVIISHMIGGTIAKKLLKQYGIEIVSHVTQIGDIKAKTVNMNLIEKKALENPVHCADPNAAKDMEELILEYKNKGDSIGGIVERIAMGIPVGIGEPIFGKLDGDLAKAFMKLSSVKGIEIGLGFDACKHSASKMNYEFYIKNENNISEKTNIIPIGTITNIFEGILGGISNGMSIITRIIVKPTPSISMVQNTINLEKKEPVRIEIKGKGDPCTYPGIITISESVPSIVLADHMLRSGFINPSDLYK